MRTNSFFAFPWYVPLLALYPPLALLAHNLGQVDTGAANRSLLISLLVALLLLVPLKKLSKDLHKAGLIVALLAILFFSYGHIYTVIKNVQFAGFLIGRHRYLVVVWLGLAGFSIWWILGKLQAVTFTKTLNLIALLWIFFPLTQIISFHIKNAGYARMRPTETEQSADIISVAENLPDVYYIILDGYGRSDVLLKNFNYDNSAFLGDLENLGFYVAECSQSNYSKTDLSLASTLNFDYINNINENLTPDNTDRTPLWDLVKHSLVAEKFRNMGYKVRSFETGFDFTQINPADTFYITPRRGFNDFENFLLKTTMAIILDDAGLFSRFQLTEEDYKYGRILFTLNTLEEIPQLVGPDFVFVHLLVPHQPFVFGPDGEQLVVQKTGSNNDEYYTDENYVSGYRNQAIFISNRITQVAEKIIESSSTPPIIIIQGDHSPSHFSDVDRMGILNAYYFPEGQPGFYSKITPVNTFRLLFSSYFDAGYPLLEDMSYYSSYPNAYQYEEIPNECEQ